MLSYLLAALGFTVLVVLHEWGHMFVARFYGVIVESFSVGMGPCLWKKKIGQTIYKLSAFPLGGYVQLKGERQEEWDDTQDDHGAFFKATPFQRIQVALAGPLVNYILAFVLFFVIYLCGISLPTTQIGEIKEGSVAQQVGLVVGDEIVSIDNESFFYWNEMVNYLRSCIMDESTFFLKIRREGELQQVEVPWDLISEDRRLGIQASKNLVEVRYGLCSSFKKALYMPYYISEMTLRNLGQMFSGKVNPKESMMGPLGIFVTARDAAQKGLISLLYFLAILSTALAFFNLLPIPVLDGGLCVFFLIEWCLGRPLPPSVQKYSQYIAISILVAFTMFAVYNDGMRLWSK